MAVGDSGYRGEMQHIKTPDLKHFCSGKEYYDASVARARHETVNLRFKSKQVLVKRFRHSLAFHLACFRAVAVITQLSIEAGVLDSRSQSLTVHGVRGIRRRVRA